MKNGAQNSIKMAVIDFLTASSVIVTDLMPDWKKNACLFIVKIIA